MLADRLAERLNRLSGRWLMAAGGALLVSTTAGYLAAARAATGSGGVPLDDAWIHQTLARNLAEVGQLVIVAGEPSAAATSPLWSALLAVAYWLGLPPLLWAMALGVVCLAGTAMAVHRLSFHLFGNRLLAGAACLLTLAEWRLVWAGLSGMETLLFSLLSLLALWLAVRPARSHLWLLGFVCGLAAATRTEGLALTLLVACWLVVARRYGPRAMAGFAIGAVLPLVPVAALNLSQYGSPLPATFFAKNAAYASGFDPARFAAFWGSALAVLARGPELLLLPGLAVMAVAGFRRFPAAAGLPLLWAAGLLAAYALWLPALYHHGRYLFPLLPLALIYGLQGSRLLVQRLRLPRLALAGAALLVLYTAYGLVRGADAYAGNIGYINSQQVWSARWVAENTAPTETIAAHDIGALAYFTRRPLLDMAGLATPSLLAGPRDVSGVVHLLQKQGVRRALIIPDWYPPLYQGLSSDWGGRPVALAPAFPGADSAQLMHILALP